MPTRFFWALDGDQPAKEAHLIPRHVLLKGRPYFSPLAIFLEDFLQLLRPPTPHTTAQHLGLMQAQVFSPIMPQSFFRASWSPASFDVRQVWTRADLQLTNNADLPQKHPCGATSSWQSNAPSTVPPVPPKKPLCLAGRAHNEHMFFILILYSRELHWVSSLLVSVC